jgi:hypothetical protein
VSGGLLVRADLAFVRLDSGAVRQLAHGDPLPDDVLDGEVERLTVAGVVGETVAEPSATAEPAPVDPPALVAGKPVSTDKPRGSRS